MKTDFSTVLHTEKCHASFDEPDNNGKKKTKVTDEKLRHNLMPIKHSLSHISSWIMNVQLVNIRRNPNYFKMKIHAYIGLCSFAWSLGSRMEMFSESYFYRQQSPMTFSKEN